MPGEIKPIVCTACGAPVPLAPRTPTPCAHCGAPVELPQVHVNLFKKTREGADKLNCAAEIWRRLPPPAPSWLPAAFLIAIFPVVVASVLGWVAATSLLGRAWSGVLVAPVMLAPPLFALYGWLEVMAYWAPSARLESRLSATRDPQRPRLTLCRGCGAPLSVAERDVAARCGYCGTESLVRYPKRQAARHAIDVQAEGARQLDNAIFTLRQLRQQRTIVRGVGLGVIIPLLIVLGVGTSFQ